MGSRSRRNLLDRVKQRRRTDRTVEPDGSRPKSPQLWTVDSSIGAIKRIALFINRDHRDHRNVRRDFFRCKHRLLQLVERTECLEYQHLDAAFDQRSDLLRESLTRLFARRLS